MTWDDRQDGALERAFERFGVQAVLRTSSAGTYAGGVRTGGAVQEKTVRALRQPTERQRPDAQGGRSPTDRVVVDLLAAELAATPAIGVDEQNSTLQIGGATLRVANVERLSDAKVIRLTLEAGK